MRRKLLTAASLLSLLLCVATAVLWVRSYWSACGFKWVYRSNAPSEKGRDVEWSLVFEGGRVFVERYVTPFPLPVDRLGLESVKYASHVDLPWFDMIGEEDRSEDRSEVLFPMAVPFLLVLIMPLYWGYLRLPKRTPSNQIRCRTCS